MNKITKAILFSIALIGCGGGSSQTITQTPPPTTTPPQDSWVVAEPLISDFMDSADAALQSQFVTRFNAAVGSLASQGLLNSGVAATVLHAVAEAEINQFISDTHDFVWVIAVNNRIDEIGMTDFMNDFKSRQLTFFNNYPYGLSATVTNLLLPMISSSLDTAYLTELLIMTQLW